MPNAVNLTYIAPRQDEDSVSVVGQAIDKRPPNLAHSSCHCDSMHLRIRRFGCMGGAMLSDDWAGYSSDVSHATCTPFIETGPTCYAGRLKVRDVRLRSASLK